MLHQRISCVILFFIFLSGMHQAQAGELINKHLPDYLKMDVQLRTRFESKDDLDFNGTADDSDAYHLMRARVSLDYTPCPKAEVFAQWQDARAANVENYANSSFEHYMDLRQAYVSLKDLIEAQGLAPHTKLTFGRQELSYGSQRLLGPVDWSNVGQSFDAGKAGFKWEDARVDLDLFGGNITPNKSPREANDFYDRSVKDTVAGYYASWAPDKKTAVEQYVISRKTNKNISFGPSGTGELDEYTAGGRLVVKELHGFDFELEAAGQWGDFQDKDIAAMMAVGVAGYTLDMAWKPRMAFELDYASGDGDGSDATRRTFDNLYPTNHIHYGYMDLFGLQTLNDYRFQVSVKPTDKLKLQSDLHVIYLDTPKDSLYSAGRAVTRTAATGGISAHAGNELDLLATYKVNAYASVMAGYSHFFAGKYLADTGANDDGDFVYTSLTLNF